MESSRLQAKYAAIGKIVSQSNFFEESYINYVSWVSKTNYWICNALMTGEGLEAKVKMLDAVFRLKIKDLRLQKEFVKLIKAVLAENSKRDHYVHARLEFVEDEIDKIVVIKAARKKIGKTTLSPKPEYVTLDELNKVSESILKANSSLFGFMLQFF